MPFMIGMFQSTRITSGIGNHISQGESRHFQPRQLETQTLENFSERPFGWSGESSTIKHSLGGI